MVLESGLQQCHPEGDELGDELGDEDPPCGYHSLGSELCIAVACSTPFEVPTMHAQRRFKRNKRGNTGALLLDCCHCCQLSITMLLYGCRMRCGVAYA